MDSNGERLVAYWRRSIMDEEKTGLFAGQSSRAGRYAFHHLTL